MGREGDVRAEKPVSESRRVSVVPLFAIFYVLPSTESLTTRLLTSVAGILVGAILVCLLTLRRGYKRFVAELLIASWPHGRREPLLAGALGARPFFGL